jgi:hypothetical protein
MSDDIRKIAQEYIDLGWAVVPLVKGEKRANTKWQSRIYTPDDFPLDAGTALKCGEPAFEIAPAFLPNTGLIDGRHNKPMSHWWYVCEGMKTRQFTGLKQPDGSKQMLVEIRSTGGYCAAAPSGHPSGDVYVWAHQREALRLTQEELIAPVNHVSIATLCAIHYPGSGARHAMVGHLAAFLCKCGVPPVVIPRIVEEAAKLHAMRTCVTA